MTELAPAQLADLAAASLANPGRMAPGRWARATALLLRQALERCVEQAWQAAGYDPERWSTRAQLLCLPRIADEHTAQTATYTWWMLTSACHHHPYELSPGHDELADLLHRVRSLTRRFAQQEQT